MSIVVQIKQEGKTEVTTTSPAPSVVEVKQVGKTEVTTTTPAPSVVEVKQVGKTEVTAPAPTSGPPDILFDWTPVLTFETPGDLVVTYLTQVGRGLIDGDSGIVTLTGTIITNTFTHLTASGNVIITGAPYISKNISGLSSFGSTRWKGITSFYTQIDSQIVANTANITMVGSESAGRSAEVTAADMPTGGAVEFQFTLNYFTG